MLIAFIFLLLLFWWAFQGYFLFLLIVIKFKKENKKDLKASNRKFNIIVPVYNEESIIEEKLRNLQNLKYDNFEVYFADASIDSTTQFIEKFIAQDQRFHLVKISKPGRSNQINTVLSNIHSDFVVVTDADSILDATALEKLDKYFEDNSVGFVGGYVVPLSKYKFDLLFWQSQNTMRILESRYGFCSVSSGAFYSFRRDIIDKQIPANVWAEDIYLPFFINTKGFRSLYAQDIKVQEIRSPGNFKDLIITKVRKAKDNMRELFRFLPLIVKMKYQWLIVFLTRFVQVVLSPLICLTMLVMLILNIELFKFFTLFLVFVICASFLQFNFLRKLSLEKAKISPFSLMKIFFITNIVLFLALISLIFKNKKHYVKVGVVAPK